MEDLAKPRATAGEGFESFLQAAVYYLDHPLKQHSQVASISDDWASALSASRDADFDRHASVFATLCRNLRPLETMPSGEPGPTHWPLMPLKLIEHYVWP